MEQNRSPPENSNGTSNNQSADTNNKKTWVPKGRPLPMDRKLGKKREHSPDREWNKTKSPPLRNGEAAKEDEGKDRPKDEVKVQPPVSQPPPMAMPGPSTSTYPNPPNGFAPPDFYAVDPTQNNYMMPQFNMFNPMNQWGASGNTPMPSMDPSAPAGINPYPYVVPNDPSMYGMMGPMAGYCPMPMMNGAMPPMPPRLPKTYPNCTLVPPQPGAPPPTRRPRPNGCKTVFIGGLPEKITDDIIREAFSECGEITTVRMSKKNFCHVRFGAEHHVDQAMLLSGWRLKIENKDESGYNSRIHVDFAVARDDQYEYDCLIRSMTREQRHAEDEGRPPSPPAIINYSECEAATLGERLRNEETFKEACEMLITWLDRGECNKRNAGTFYSMIQSTFSHVRRLVADKAKIEEEVTQVKQKLMNQCNANANSFNDIERVFSHASAQKVWDHFTKAQRKHIEMWKKQTVDTRVQNLDDLLEDRVEDEMEMSDSEDKEAPVNVAELTAALAKAREDIEKEKQERIKIQEDARKQTEAYNEEKKKMKEDGEKKISALSDAYKLMQHNYVETKKKLEEKEKLAIENQKAASNVEPTMNGGAPTSENDARLIAMIATFLNCHPLGASIDYICSYLQKMAGDIDTREVENVMRKHNTLFKEVFSGIGATLEKKWIFHMYRVLYQSIP